MWKLEKEAHSASFKKIWLTKLNHIKTDSTFYFYPNSSPEYIIKEYHNLLNGKSPRILSIYPDRLVGPKKKYISAFKSAIKNMTDFYFTPDSTNVKYFKPSIYYPTNKYIFFILLGIVMILNGIYEENKSRYIMHCIVFLCLLVLFFYTYLLF